MLLMRLCEVLYEGKFSGVWKEMSNEMKDGLKLKLGDATCVTPRNIQEVQASKLGDAQGIPLLHQ